MEENERKTTMLLKNEENQEEETTKTNNNNNICSSNNNTSPTGTDTKVAEGKKNKPKSSTRRGAETEHENKAKTVRFSPPVEINVEFEENSQMATTEVKPLEKLPSSTAGKAKNKMSRSPSQFSLGETEEEGLKSPPLGKNDSGSGWSRAAATAGELAAVASNAAWTAGSWTAQMVAALGRGSNLVSYQFAVKCRFIFCKYSQLSVSHRLEFEIIVSSNLNEFEYFH